MKTVVTYLIILVSALGFSQEKIAWKDDPLTWEDFKGKPDNSSPFLASTNSGFSFGWSVKYVDQQPVFDFEVVGLFYPEQSWRKADTLSNNLLKHEQLHFDISELHARKLRKLLSETEISTIPQAKALVKKAYQRIEQERIKMQKTYDKETDHSKNKEAQQRWNTFIAEELKKLEDFR